MILIEKTNKKGRYLFYNTENTLVALECSACKEIHSISNFHKSKTPTGVVSQCKECVRKQHQKYCSYDKTYVINLKPSGELESRQCSKCLILKDSSHFYKSKNGVGGHYCSCKSCESLSGKQYNLINKEKISIKSKEYYKKNTEKVKQAVKVYRDKNKDIISIKKREYEKNVRNETWWKEKHTEKRKKQCKNWRNNNSEHVKNYNKKYKTDNLELCKKIASRRVTSKRTKTPKWLTEDHKEQIDKIYKEMRELNSNEGYRAFHVDHIIPLQGSNVSGLHVPWNLQILTSSENSSKNNSFDGTYENDSWRTNG